MRSIKIFDTTLRDGEQAPGNAMTLPQKRKLVALLDNMNVDYIEAGFPAASQEDFQSVQQAVAMNPKATIVAFARAKKEDIDIAHQITIRF